MFGQMNVAPLFQFQSGDSNDSSDLDRAVSALLDKTDHPEIARWIQFPAAVLLFLVVPGDPEGGAFYVFDRKRRTWFWVDFEDKQYGGYAIADFEELVKRTPFLQLIEQPRLLQGGGRWFVQPGSPLCLV
ncbi:MAG TPA: hypothetical protein VKV95_11430 [Terriglobia bacterium]|nr:hypothetical protein [Terriglobia bacterium]